MEGNPAGRTGSPSSDSSDNGVRPAPEGCSSSSDMGGSGELEGFWKTCSIYEAQREWLSVVSELTQRLNKGKSPVLPEAGLGESRGVEDGFGPESSSVSLKTEPGSANHSGDTCIPGSANRSRDTCIPGSANHSRDTCIPGSANPSRDTCIPGSANQSRNTCRSANHSRDTCIPGSANHSRDTCIPGSTNHSRDTCILGSANQSRDTCRSANHSKDTCTSANHPRDTCRSANPSRDTCIPGSANQSRDTCRSANHSKDTCTSANHSRDTCRSANHSKDTCTSANPSRDTCVPGSANHSRDTCIPGSANHSRDTCIPGSANHSRDTCIPGSANHSRDTCRSANPSRDTCIPGSANHSGDTCIPDVIYDDVPADSPQHLLEEGIYEDVEVPDQQHSNGWSSGEFESYEEVPDGENVCPSTDSKVQQFLRAARTRTRTTLAMFRKVSFLQKKNCSAEDSSSYLDFSVCELKHPPAKLRPQPEGLSSQQVVRRLILSSIVQSEISYLDSLKRVLQEYQKPLLEPQHLILNPKKIHQIFYRVKEIHLCHSMFQIALASRVSEWDQSEMIGDLFVASFSKSMVVDVYRDYINNFTSAMTLIKKACVSKPSFLDFLKKTQASSPDRITLYGLMVKPVQRFPQFILLLQDMLKNTSKSHPDRLPLQLALTELETLAEKLNEEKRLADQEAEIQQLVQGVGDRNLSKRLNSEQLIQCDLLTEVVFGENGQVLKSKQRKLFLLNDTLICAGVNLKGHPDISSFLPLAPRYSLKWSAPLRQTRVVEVGQEGVVRRSSSTGSLFLHPRRLYQEMEELQHDLAVVEEVSELVGTLHGTYQNLNSTVSQDWHLALQRLIHLKEEEIQNANKCRLRLSVPGKPDRAGRPVSVMVVFNTPSPHSKISWMNRLHLAKIAQRKENTPGWESAEDDGKTKTLLSSPLLSCSLPVFSSGAQTLRAALHIPSQAFLLGPCCPSTCLPQGYLWVAGGSDSHSRVDIFSLNRSTPRLVKSLRLRAPVLCLEQVKEEEEEEDEEEEGVAAASRGNMICVGLQDGSIQVHSSMDTSVELLQTLETPGGCPVLCLCCSTSFLFAGLSNGTVVEFRAAERLWEVDSFRPVGSDPVCSLLALPDSVWAGCGNRVTVIQAGADQTQTFQAHQDPGCSVTRMVHSGGGVWMCFSQSSSIHLFHTETLEALQEVTVSPHSPHTGPVGVQVSSLLICQGLLWVGTSQGLILTFPVPSLEGIPKITGKGMTSLNAHCGPVDLLVSACSSLPSDFPRCDGEEAEDQGGEEARPDQPEARPPRQDRARLLRYRLSSTHELPGKVLTAKPEQDGDPADSPEHRPEDGSIYELSEDPDVWVRGRDSAWGGKGREARRGRLTSTAVFSAGSGCRRVDQPDGADATNNMLMVWQLALTVSR
ncbi:rho guanine nucleotide exchange factor 10-like protein [Cololabis saira]|uniref:rho guanine nucleotide exchange factor 10-like protein n=1 Tax=Cololabis saira TaxID=129043 RepID=UPI002AD49210|nr:rho guanine nucleotide exchange factor 10-like protein [Cololabis saira]